MEADREAPSKAGWGLSRSGTSWDPQTASLGGPTVTAAASLAFTDKRWL